MADFAHDQTDSTIAGAETPQQRTVYVDGPAWEGAFPAGYEDFDHIFFKVEQFSSGITYTRPDKPISEFSAKELGDEGERMAASYLERHGYEVLFTKWVTPFGETDIVAKDPSGVVTLIEVKTRLALGDTTSLMPELAVDPRKKSRYKAMAFYYCAINSGLDSVRFDVIGIDITEEHMAKLHHVKGAFEWDEQ